MQVSELDADELAIWIHGGERLRLIDVRTSAEASRGVIPKAEVLPLHLLPLRADEVGHDARVVFYCRSGARSAQACAFMNMRGHRTVYNLRGGIVAWLQQGLPLDPPLG